jgi:hypothetical protein
MEILDFTQGVFVTIIFGSFRALVSPFPEATDFNSPASLHVQDDVAQHQIRIVVRMVVLVLASMNNNNILLELWHVFQDTDCRVACCNEHQMPGIFVMEILFDKVDN